MDCFISFCEEQQSPWNIIDNILNQKGKPTPLLKDPNSKTGKYTTSSAETAKLLSTHMFPDDIRETDTPHHQTIRDEVTNFLASSSNDSIDDLTMSELQSSIFSFSPYKTLNPDDSIYPVMIQQTFDISYC